MKKPVLERLKMYFSVVLKEEAIVRNTTPSGIWKCLSCQEQEWIPFYFPAIISIGRISSHSCGNGHAFEGIGLSFN